MQDPRVVRARERVSDLSRDPQCGGHGQEPLAGNVIVECLAVDELHDEVRRALEDACVQHAHDSRVGEATRGQ